MNCLVEIRYRRLEERPPLVYSKVKQPLNAEKRCSYIPLSC